MSLPAVPKKLAVTGRIQSWIDNPDGRLPVSCTVFVPEDSMEGEDGIEDSWLFASKALRKAAGVAVHLSKLRPKGTDNGKGLVSSGAVSFGEIYSKLNEILRRGGTYKNGAITLHLDYDHPDALEFITAPRSKFPWAKRCLNVDDGFIDWPHLETAMKAIKAGDLWLVKKSFDDYGARIYHNVCVSGDTLVMTSKGVKTAKELVGQQFEAIVDGKAYTSTDRGFFSTGFRETVKVETKEGYEIECTPSHEFRTPDGWLRADELKAGQKVVMNRLDEADLEWDGVGSFDEGWLVGWLIGDGTYQKDGEVRLDFYGTKSNLLSQAIEKIARLEGKEPKVYSSNQTDRMSVHSKALAKVAEGYAIQRGSKHATQLIELASSSFQKGFVQGYFDADGTVSLGVEAGNGKCVTLTSISLQNLKTVQRILLRFGIRSRIWKEKYNGTKKSMPDGKGGMKLYQTQKASRLDISGRRDLQRFYDLIGFSLEEKQEKLSALLSSYKKTAYFKPFHAVVESVKSVGVQEVFDCTIPAVGQFDGNGFRVSNCLEIQLKPRGTCLLAHVNLGQCELADIVPAFVDGMKFLCELHPQTQVDGSGIYLPPTEDKQVGLGILGLANFLAKEGVTYKELVQALENRAYAEKSGLGHYHDIPSDFTVQDAFTAYEEGDADKVDLIAFLFEAAYDEAAIVAKKHDMDRAFTIAPTASCSYRYTDSLGYTTTPEIAPPIDRQVERDSTTFGSQTFDYPPNVETAEEVGWDVFFRLNCCFQHLLDRNGLGHAISMNWWSDLVEFDNAFIQRWLESPLKSLYYSLQVMTGTQDKSAIIGSEEVDLSVLGLDIFPTVDEELAPVTNPLGIQCLGCAE